MRVLSVIFVLCCQLLSLALFSAIVAAGDDSRRFRQARQDIGPLATNIWLMDKDEIAVFCRQGLADKQRATAMLERDMALLLDELATALPGDRAAELKRRQLDWRTERARRADLWFSGEDNLSEQDQADLHATCYPQKSPNRASYDLITTRNRLNHLSTLLKEDAGPGPLPGGDFAGLYAGLWLPTGYGLLEISLSEKDAGPEQAFELLFQAEAIRPTGAGFSCSIRLPGQYRAGRLEFFDNDHPELMIQVSWVGGKSGLLLRAVRADDPTEDFEQAAGYYCGQGLDFAGQYHSLDIR